MCVMVPSTSSVKHCLAAKFAFTNSLASGSELMNPAILPLHHTATSQMPTLLLTQSSTTCHPPMSMSSQVKMPSSKESKEHAG
ncbi:hypothetical protein TcWFU_009732 [Taenia crassiceps]|uniref:Uncharacterized protein n=1 Tax=Taenia crassiceps TaxID=6207 RepID=A0ABR4QJA9_9CEST